MTGCARSSRIAAEVAAILSDPPVGFRMTPQGPRIFTLNPQSFRAGDFGMGQASPFKRFILVLLLILVAIPVLALGMVMLLILITLALLRLFSNRRVAPRCSRRIGSVPDTPLRVVVPHARRGARMIRCARMSKSSRGDRITLARRDRQRRRDRFRRMFHDRRAARVRHAIHG